MNPTHIRRRIKLRDLDTLTVVAKTGGLRKAAELLHLSQPAVSKAIAALEESFGYPLLERSHKGAELTVYGHALIQRSESIFDELQQSARELADIADPHSGEIRLSCSEPVVAGLLSVAMQRMLRLYPKVTFRIESAGSPSAHLGFLMARDTDFIITRPSGLTISKELRAEALYYDDLKVIVARNSPWAKRRNVRLADLVDEAWILSSAEVSGGDSPVYRTFEAAELELPRCQIVTSSIQGRLAMLAQGRYVTLMPKAFLHYGTAVSTVRILPIRMQRWPTPNMILTLRSRKPSPTVSAFLQILRELAKPLQADSALLT